MANIITNKQLHLSISLVYVTFIIYGWWPIMSKCGKEKRPKHKYKCVFTFDIYGSFWNKHVSFMCTSLETSIISFYWISSFWNLVSRRKINICRYMKSGQLWYKEWDIWGKRLPKSIVDFRHRYETIKEVMKALLNEFSAKFHLKVHCLLAESFFIDIISTPQLLIFNFNLNPYKHPLPLLPSLFLTHS